MGSRMKRPLARGRDRLAQAQELIYQAWDAPSAKRRAALALRALAASADCADAYVILAEASAPLDEALELYRRGVDAGERALGRNAFKEDVGYFWGILETRPYMRARAGLAKCLWEKGQREDAVQHLSDMLRLNPNDNQGLRYVLAACLLEMDRDDEVSALLKAYDEDAGTEFAWAHALLMFRKQGDGPESRERLNAAIESNRHIPDFLLGKKRLPRALPDMVGIGDVDEAACYASDNLESWRATSGALDWLAARAQTQRPVSLA